MHYRETVVWQKATDAALAVFRLAGSLPREEIYGMRSQLTRAATSIPANIAEGWTRETPRDKVHFLAIAQGSLAETETLIALYEGAGWLAESDTTAAKTLLEEVSRILTVMRRNRRT